ncbi:hypothetical protein I3760_11G133700 [Carya illinoinensis]|uniref:Protein kinase domain-containing protein n=1 Tax=Carya illinoinensis TaxID=32201 RepID=A0A8T1P4T8_CARIL|nr:probable LRR receptor-like serine/threonine-protein kinase At1g63430 [Carya illinoinensis]KAG2681217.1 hypothetical protein I3760_11G133700 [Carya illinoinensis]KAG6636824.1 hypothetical protein CIPAW_11G137500 [Carya illinoinensis]
MSSYTSLLLLCLISGILFAEYGSSTSYEVAVLTTFKEAIFEDPLLVLSNWNALDPDPCDWYGISCTKAREHVIELNISGSSLRGFLAPELGQLNFLRELILHGNNLIGIIPKELGMLKFLQVLDLGMNQLSGHIPPEIGRSTSLVKINLQSNELTGGIRPELGNLRYLQELWLDRNKLQGNIPAAGSPDFSSEAYRKYGAITNFTSFCHLKVANFSHNLFVGSIPKCLEYLPSTSFQGNCLQNKDSKQRPATQCSGPSPAKSHTRANTTRLPVGDVSKHQGPSKPAWLLALEVATATMVGFILLVAILTALQKCNSKSSIIIPWRKSTSGKDHMTVCIESELLKDVVQYSRQDLEIACEDFSNIIGSSPDSVVYKGTMKGGPEIAVISLCIKEEHWTGYLELYFQREVADLARLNHENTGKLLGYCRESTPFTRMLVFEYASNGTLYEHLHHGEGCHFSWSRRMKIAIGIARGLEYLHTALEPPFTISELNSSAIYLTEDFSPKLVDFECWKTILSRSERNSGAIGSQGAICILPNSLEARHLDIQGNVYAFGVLLLEIISGRPPYCKEKGCLVEWAKDYLELPEVMSYVVDPELKHFRYDELKVICEVVNLCIHPDSSKRLSMKEVCNMLESKIDLSISVDFKTSSLAWAELALSS